MKLLNPIKASDRLPDKLGYYHTNLGYNQFRPLLGNFCEYRDVESNSGFATELHYPQVEYWYEEINTELSSEEILPLDERGLFEVCQSSKDIQHYAERLEYALECAENELMSNSIKETVEPIKFKYKNWKGVISERNVMPITVWFGSTEFHTEPQLLLKAYDLDKDVERDFALKDIQY